jgi:NADH-quinone oxidoreductase subunit F
VICNADEGDPGAFMDRSLLEGDPHAVIEGMIIAAFAIGANGGVIYCRAEYPLAIHRLNIALGQARDKGYLGDNIAGITGFNLDIVVKEGAGAFVCGEETALMASVEGKRGMPAKRPPFPAVKGLWGYPTNINNVETYANVPWIISNGAENYAQYGTAKSKGTKVFALTGKIARGGLVEVPMGITIRDIVYKLGGGIRDNKRFKAVQLGGPSGGCIPEHLIDTAIDYDSVTATGAIMGSGGMVVMDETTCMVDMARFFLDFTQKESCGKCTFCRIGTKRMLEILTRICEGEGKAGDIETLEELAYQIKDSSLCGLGQTAPNPVLTTIRYFRDEYEAHIRDKKCPAKNCKQLLTYEVIADNCTGCMVCAKNCSVDAISGIRKQLHFIDQARCIKCGVCFTKCKFEAILVY